MGYTMQEVLNDEENTLRLYFDDIADSKPLSLEKEVELASRIKGGDMHARARIASRQRLFGPLKHRARLGVSRRVLGNLFVEQGFNFPCHNFPRSKVGPSLARVLRPVNGAP